MPSYSMGTLTEITERAGNAMKRQSNSSMGYQSLDSPNPASKSAEKENSVKSKSPHFMTPTFSSSLQSVTTASITPIPSTNFTKAEGSNTWMKSAAKRVGFRRTGDGTPRSKKEGPPKNIRMVSFPDKVCFTSDLMPDVLLTSLACYPISQQSLRHSPINKDAASQGFTQGQASSQSSHGSNLFTR